MRSDDLKILLQFLLPKYLLTRLAGYIANQKTPWIKNWLIRHFMKKYEVSLTEACEEHPENYESFNAFFVRHLKPECRPIAAADIVSPVDGYISEIGHIKEGALLQAKGHYYSVEELLRCDSELSTQFKNGLFTTLYLSPKDYHRVHMPIKATLKDEIYLPGRLFSVQPATTRTISKLFAQNERLVVFFETSVGLMAMVLVGAVIVGAIGTAWGGDITRRRVACSTQPSTMDLNQGDEMGYFKLGSTVIVLFAEGTRVQWIEGLAPGDKIRLGEALGQIMIE